MRATEVLLDLLQLLVRGRTFLAQVPLLAKPYGRFCQFRHGGVCGALLPRTDLRQLLTGLGWRARLDQLAACVHRRLGVRLLLRADRSDIQLVRPHAVWLHFCLVARRKIRDRVGWLPGIEYGDACYAFSLPLVRLPVLPEVSLLRLLLHDLEARLHRLDFVQVRGVLKLDGVRLLLEVAALARNQVHIRTIRPRRFGGAPLLFLIHPFSAILRHAQPVHRVLLRLDHRRAQLPLR